MGPASGFAFQGRVDPGNAEAGARPAASDYRMMDAAE